jgi:type I restriction enzyme S subunit
MSAEWPIMSLKEASVSLIDCVHKTPPAADSGYPYVAIPQMKSGRIDISEARKISKEHLEEWTKKAKPVFNDVILSRRCNPGETAFVDRGLQCALGQNLVLLRADGTKVYPPFLRWLVRSPEWWGQVEKFINAGAVFDSLKCADIPNFRLTIPPVENQKVIADFLGALDDKIELNRQINQTLEQIAQTIFKSWFVDFEPVKAKIEAKAVGRDPERAAMCGISGKLEAELDQLSPEQRQQLAATAALFPDELLESELGLIPEGWAVKELIDVANYQNGLALQKFRPTDENDYLPVVKIAQLKKGVADSGEKASPDIKPECIIDNGDVVFSWSGSLMVDIWCGGKAALNQHLFKVTSPDYPKWFYYFWTKHHLEEFQRIAADKAVTMGHIKRSHLKEALCAVPVENLSGYGIVGDLIARQIECRLENLTLAEARDTLLPKLLSGELTAGECERQVEACP